MEIQLRCDQVESVMWGNPLRLNPSTAVAAGTGDGEDGGALLLLVCHSRLWRTVLFDVLITDEHWPSADAAVGDLSTPPRVTHALPWSPRWWRQLKPRAVHWRRHWFYPWIIVEDAPCLAYQWAAAAGLSAGDGQEGQISSGCHLCFFVVKYVTAKCVRTQCWVFLNWNDEYGRTRTCLWNLIYSCKKSHRDTKSLRSLPSVNWRVTVTRSPQESAKCQLKSHRDTKSLRSLPSVNWRVTVTQSPSGVCQVSNEESPWHGVLRSLSVNWRVTVTRSPQESAKCQLKSPRDTESSGVCRGWTEESN